MSAIWSLKVSVGGPKVGVAGQRVSETLDAGRIQDIADSSIARTGPTLILELNTRESSPARILTVTTFYNGPSGNEAFALVKLREIVMPIVRYIVWVGTSLLALLFVANWCFLEPPQEAAHEAIAKPIIRIASDQHSPEPVIIDTNQPTIVPPPMPLGNAIPDAPSPLQSYASAEPPPATFDVHQKKRKNLKRQRAKVAAYQLPSVSPHVVASGGSATTVPLTKLSLIDIVSGVGKKLFNLR